MLKHALVLSFYVAFVESSDGVGHTRFIGRSENVDQFTPGHKPVFLKLPQNVSRGDMALSFHEVNKWTNLLAWAREVWSFMMCWDNQHDGNRYAVHRKQNGFILIFTDELIEVMVGWEKTFSCRGVLIKVAVWRLPVFCGRQEILKVLSKSLTIETEVRSVIVASSHVDFVYIVLDIIATDMMFKWRRFLHATEYLALTTNRLAGSSNLPGHKNFPDFVTFLSAKPFGIDVAQKSRTQPMKIVLRLQWDLNPFSCRGITPANCSSRVNLTHPAVSPLNASLFSQHLRRDATVYLSSQKSVMAGMHIPTIVVVSEVDHYVFQIKDGNRTSWSGYCIAVVNLLSETLGFTAHPYPVRDHGFYGGFEETGELLGVTGERFVNHTIMVKLLGVTGERFVNHTIMVKLLGVTGERFVNHTIMVKLLGVTGERFVNHTIMVKLLGMTGERFVNHTIMVKLLGVTGERFVNHTIMVKLLGVTGERFVNHTIMMRLLRETKRSL